MHVHDIERARLAGDGRDVSQDRRRARRPRARAAERHTLVPVTAALEKVDVGLGAAAAVRQDLEHVGHGQEARSQAATDDCSSVTRLRDLMEAPRISVLIGAWNNAATLPRAINSILTQTLTDLELLVLDDGSEDDTEAVVGAIGDERVRYEKLPHRGIAATLNHGLAAARSELVANLDADDWALEDRLRRQVELLDARPDVAVVGCRPQGGDECGAGVRHRTGVKSGDRPPAPLSGKPPP